jgi:hypothetical protein
MFRCEKNAFHIEKRRFTSSLLNLKNKKYKIHPSKAISGGLFIMNLLRREDFEYLRLR